MVLTKWDPFSELDELQKNLFDGLNRREMSMPNMDVYEEKGEKIVVETHAPGFSKDDIEVDLHEGVLEIRAEKSDRQEEDKDRKYMLKESSSSFYRRVRLPKHIDEDKIDAHFDNGSLKVEIPYKELPKPKKVKIKSKNK